MTTIVTSTILDAPAEEVWLLLRDFSAIGSWHPFLPPPTIEDGPADRVGAVRVFGDHRERLVALDDLRRSTRFAFEDSGRPPVRDYDPKVVAQVRDGVL